jgi:hypothetical protein
MLSMSRSQDDFSTCLSRLLFPSSSFALGMKNSHPLLALELLLIESHSGRNVMPVVLKIFPTRGREFWDSLDPNNNRQVLEAVKEEFDRPEPAHYSLGSWAVSNDFDIDRITPLWNTVFNNESDEKFWNKVSIAVAKSTRPLPNLDQTPYSFNTSSFVNTSEYRKHVDDV